MTKLIIYSDGGSRGNPGHAACAFVIKDGDTKETIFEGGRYLGDDKTNNFAEYHGIYEAIMKASELGFTELHCYMDSELIINQLKGLYKIKSPDLKEIYLKIQDYIFMKPVTFTHIPRSKNARADALVNKILDKVS